MIELYANIVRLQVLHVTYQPYKARQPRVLTVFPSLLKEFRDRWFLFASKQENMELVTLALDRIVGFEVEEGGNTARIPTSTPGISSTA